MTDILLSLVTGVISGIISGLYTAIIGAKYTAFQENKREILKVLRSIHYDEKYLKGHEDSELNRIFLASSDLLTMKQIGAGKVIRFHYAKLMNDIDGKSDKNILSEEILLDFQKAVNELKVNKLELLRFW